MAGGRAAASGAGSVGGDGVGRNGGGVYAVVEQWDQAGVGAAIVGNAGLDRCGVAVAGGDGVGGTTREGDGIFVEACEPRVSRCAGGGGGCIGEARAVGAACGCLGGPDGATAGGGGVAEMVE